MNQGNISDLSLKYHILAGIRQASRLPGGIDSLRDAKSASGIGENERKVLEALNKDKTKLLDGLKDGFQKQLAEQIKDELTHYKAVDHIPVIFGGIIPESDFETLRKIGVKEIFTPKDFDLMKIMDKIIDLIAKQKKAA